MVLEVLEKKFANFVTSHYRWSLSRTLQTHEIGGIEPSNLGKKAGSLGAHSDSIATTQGELPTNYS
jgi:hypothetical protein